MAIDVFDYFPDSPVAIIGELTPSGTVTVELWEDGVAVTGLVSNACLEIDSTGKYSWSTANIPVMNSSRQQFHWRMTESMSSGIFESDFILQSPENDDGGMPSLNNPDSYILRI